jgi:tetratricopeptide (TPR) repeat protein
MIDIEAALAEALAAQQAGDPGRAASGYATALAGFDALLVLEPPTPLLLGNRGFVLSQLGRPGDALDSYDRALALDPGFVDALYSRAVILLEQGRAAEAVAGFDAVLARQPGHGGALGNRGQALL